MKALSTVLLTVLVFLGARLQADAAPFRVVAYYAEWDAASGYGPDRIPAAKLDVVDYAFADATADGSVRFVDVAAAQRNIEGLQRLKRQYPKLRIMLSIGGWSMSKHFSTVARNPKLRARFCAQALKAIVDNGFDGVDIDWEYPVADGLPENTASPADRHNCTLLMRDLRSALGTRLLTMAIPGTARTLAHYDTAALAKSVDWFNLMTYDLAPDGPRRAAHHAPLYSSAPGEASVESAVRILRGSGVAPSKIVVGVPFYGHSWRGVSPRRHGIGQPAAGFGRRGDDEGIFTYAQIAALPRAQYAPRVDDRAQATYIYAPSVEGGLFISYDDAASIRRKAAYALEHGLGGVMCWALSHDPSGTLVDAMRP